MTFIYVFTHNIIISQGYDPRVGELFPTRFNRIRISKIAEVWGKANKFEVDFYKLYDASKDEKIFRQFKETNLTKKETLMPYIEAMNKSRIELMKVLHKNSFYLGKNLEKQVLEFYRDLAVIKLYQKINLDTELSNITESITPASMEKAKIEVDRFRANISQIRNYIIDGGK